MMNTNGRKTIIVLGPMRSGTSMTAGVLSKLGVEMVRSSVESSRANPLGYFEDTEVHDLNTKILEAAGGSRHSPPPRESILEVRDDFEDSIREILKNEKKRCIGFKDPGFSLTIECIVHLIENPYIIVCKRDIDKSSNSYRRMVGEEINNHKELIRTYEYRIKDFCDRYTEIPTLNVIYEDFLNKPIKHTHRLNKFLGITQKEKIIKRASNHVKNKGYIRVRQIFELLKSGMKRPNKATEYIKKQIYLFFN